MGILIFGTPTLLLLGYDFFTSLSFLLPASFAISLLQVLDSRLTKAPIPRDLYFLCLPGIGFGLWVSGSSYVITWTNTLVGVILLLTSLIRFWPPFTKQLSSWLKNYRAQYHLAMGVVHGMTNLGGGLLAVLASVTQTKKEFVRYTVAYYYLAFSLIQMLTLAILLGQHHALLTNSLTMIISGAIYILIGNRIFRLTKNEVYSIALNIFIAAYGFAVLFNL
jgi:uncharacterized membrane protein YfcA